MDILKLLSEHLHLILIILFMVLLLSGFFILVILFSFHAKLKEYFVDDSGKLSMGRLVMFLSIFFFAVTAAYTLLSSGVFPDIPAVLAGLVMALYGVNKFSPTIPFHNHDEHHEEH
jgi:fatty acid desaturase